MSLFGQKMTGSCYDKQGSTFQGRGLKVPSAHWPGHWREPLRKSTVWHNSKTQTKLLIYPSLPLAPKKLRIKENVQLFPLATRMYPNIKNRDFFLNAKSDLFKTVKFIKIKWHLAILYQFSQKEHRDFYCFLLYPKIAKNHPILIKLTVLNRSDFAIFKKKPQFFEFG